MEGFDPASGELAHLKAIALLSRIAAGSAALTDEPLDQQGLAPYSRTSLSCIKKTGDVSKRLCFIHAFQNRREIFANRFANGPALDLRLKPRSIAVEWLRGPFQPS